MKVGRDAGASAAPGLCVAKAVWPARVPTNTKSEQGGHEVVVDPAGHVYVNGADFDCADVAGRHSGCILDSA